VRYIPIDGLNLPDGWTERAENALEQLIMLEPEERSDYINNHSAIWRDRELKAALSALSKGKCWYCESKEIRSDRVIDHFRPKNSVAERNDHPGYWWLAFNLSNYRYSCTFCNSLRKSEADEPSGGKSDHFPIVDENRRAYEPNNPIQDEFPFILDPRSQGDTLLITFEDDGRAIPCYANDENSLHCKRAIISIRIYHLNHPDVKEARFTVCNEIHELVKEGDRAFLRQDENIHTALVGKESFDGIVRRIRSMVDRDAEYSRAARAVLSSHRTKPWVESILEDSN
jgi:hypothetical protein